MCGITGIVLFDGEVDSPPGGIKTALEASVASLHHRGPDFHQTKSWGHVGLGHARLSIIDTSDLANQPMSDKSENYTLVFNGEIFNYQELRTELEAFGVQFNTNSDTEVLLQLLIKHGKQALSKLNGFFAFAFFDRTKNALLLARDRYGVKPLWYCATNRQFVFASELKALLKFDIPRQLDRTALSLLLQLSYIPAPHSIIEGVHKLQPGYLIEVHNGAVAITQWYNPEINFGHTPVFGDAVIHVRELLNDSVKLRLISDVPIGTFLSGGVDSSVVTMLAARQHEGIHSFSIGFPDDPYFDETKSAQAVAKQVGSSHRVFAITNREMLDNVDTMLDALDEPFADSSALAVYVLSKHVRRHVTVALSGDGADELFAGYNKYEALRRANSTGLSNEILKFAAFVLPVFNGSRSSSFQNKIRQLKKYAAGLKLTPAERYWLWTCFTSPELVGQLLPDVNADRSASFNAPAASGDYMNAVLLMDQQLVLPNDMLTKVDSMSMANSLEVRTPFLDYRLVEFVNALPSQYKINSSGRKLLLKEAFKNDLPAEVFAAPKKGFEIPLERWLRGELRGHVEIAFDKTRIQQQGIFSADKADEIKYLFLEKNRNEFTSLVWSMIVFQRWYRKYMD